MTARDEFLTDPGAGRDTVRAVARVEPPGIELHDDIQGHTENLLTSAPFTLDECVAKPFCFPVDRAYRISFSGDETSKVVVPKPSNSFVLDDDAQQVADIVSEDVMHVDEGSWTVDISSLGMKVYLAVEGSIRSDIEGESRRLFFPESDEIFVGLRSLHERPAATVHTGTSPRAIMRAISCFGSVLKTHSAERSFPTLRGHPPLIDVHHEAPPDWFDAPPGLEQTPDAADILIRVPERLSAVYPVATLAYYLNAAVVPGDPGLLVGERSVPLVGDEAMAETIDESAARILEHVFTLDCATRTEGFYKVALGEREQIESAASETGACLDWAELYEASLSDRVARYLSLPHSVVADSVPRWPIAAHLEAEPERAAFLPFIADALGTISTVEDGHGSARQPATEAQHAAVTDFLRNRSDVDGSDEAGANGISDAVGLPVEERTVTIPRTDAITDLWCAPGHPIGGAEPTLEACQRRLTAQPSGTIDVAVVSNSPAMRGELDVQNLYGVRELLAFDVSIYQDLTTDALSSVLATNHDLVHFIGHVSGKGLQTTDGWLDARELPQGSVGTRAFVLNACRSYAQGRAIVDAGAIGGLCTVSPVGNAPATEVGRAVARLLNLGFTLGGALDIIHDRSIMGQQYSIVGDPRIAVTEGKGGTPNRLHVERCGTDRFRVVKYGYPSPSMNLGSIYLPRLGETRGRNLNSGKITEVLVGGDELADFLSMERVPLTLEDDEMLHWSDQLSVSEIE